MTRLVQEDVARMAATLPDYQDRLQQLCGKTLREIAILASGNLSSGAARVAVIPVTAGLGVIPDFCESVVAIVEFLGCKARVTRCSDLNGMEEAYAEDDILFMANDETFLAINLRTQRVSNNNDATARGFATALACMAGGLDHKNVLLLGAGTVGTCAARTLIALGAQVDVYDTNTEKSELLQRQLPAVQIQADLKQALEAHTLIFEATPSGGFLTRDLLREGTMIAAPGVPCGIAKECMGHVRCVHDVLEIGVATMLMDVL